MTLATIIEAWPIIATFGALLIALGAGRAALNTVTAQINDLSRKVDTATTVVTTIATAVAVQNAQLAAHTEQDRIQFLNIERRLEQRTDA